MALTRDQSETPEPLSNWSHKITDIPDRGLDVERSADAAQLAALTEALDVMACQALTVTYRVKPNGGGRYTVKGEISVNVVQACIVTLEPVPSKISETFQEEFWPPELVPAAAAPAVGEADEREALSHSTPETIDNGTIDIGRLIFETISTSLDPYPRADGAAFDWTDAEESTRANPFAALAALKERK